MNLLLTEQDFDRLWDTSMEWQGAGWEAQDGRFSPPISYRWKRAYWFELAYANFVIACSYLEEQGHKYETAEDEAGGWVIVTNYESKEVLV
jgi:hypothetical protein